MPGDARMQIARVSSAMGVEIELYSLDNNVREDSPAFGGHATPAEFAVDVRVRGSPRVFGIEGAVDLGAGWRAYVG